GNIGASDLGDQDKQVVDTDHAGRDQVAVDLGEQRLLDRIVTRLQKGDLDDQQLVGVGHAEIAAGMTEALPVVLVEQLIPVCFRHCECVDESCLDRGGDRVLFFGRAALEQIHLYERHVRVPCACGLEMSLGGSSEQCDLDAMCGNE